jgi:uncharacterized protein
VISRRAILKGVGTFAAGTIGLAGYAFAIEPIWRMNVTRYRLSPSAWPVNLKLSIAVIADVHAGEPFMSADRIVSIASATNALNPDMTVLLGDFSAAHKFITKRLATEAWAEAIATLRAPLGVHSVLGNHDWWEDGAAQRAGRGPTIARRVLEKFGIPVYENDAVRLVKDGRRFWLAGLGDQIALKGFRRGRRIYQGVDDLPSTLAMVTDDAPIILLAHEPDIFPRVPKRVSLTLSGHTHGGQIRFFGYSPIVPSRYGNRFAYGHVIEQNRHLIVSGGLGCSFLPVRCGLPPEIVLVELG